MHLLLINPNTSQAMTAALGAAARAAAAPGWTVDARQPRFGPASIEGHAEEAIAAAGVADVVRGAVSPAPDAVVVACFGDPGVDAARELTGAPVLGIAEAAFHAACMLADVFSVLTTLERTVPMTERLLARHGFERRCRGVHASDIPVLALESADAGLIGRLEAAARAALARDGSEALVLGCAGMAPLCTELQQRLGVPVIDGVAAAVKFAEAFVGLGWRTPKRGRYAPPLPKRWDGWAEAFGAPPGAAAPASHQQAP